MASDDSIIPEPLGLTRIRKALERSAVGQWVNDTYDEARHRITLALTPPADQESVLRAREWYKNDVAAERADPVAYWQKILDEVPVASSRHPYVPPNARSIHADRLAMAAVYRKTAHELGGSEKPEASGGMMTVASDQVNEARAYREKHADAMRLPGSGTEADPWAAREQSGRATLAARSEGQRQAPKASQT